jgi:AcrR family transcriptional regulator
MPRVGLTRETLIATATAIADEHGLAAVTMHALARQYGVAAPSMYKHVRNLEDLHSAIAAEGLVLFERSLRASDGSVTGLARAYRAFASNHPGLYDASQSPALTAQGQGQEISRRVVSLIASVLPENLSPDDTVDSVRIIRSALHGFVTLERDGGFGQPASADRTFEELCTVLTMIVSLRAVAKRTS